MSNIYTHDTIYIPPHEEENAPLEVAIGCSWGKCTFCDFARDRFTVHSDEKILENIKGLAEIHPQKTRVFFLGENAFVLSTDRLLRIMAAVKEHMPQVTEFAMYARIDDVLGKTEHELLELKEAGLSALHIGIESGCDSILLEIKKGVTSQEILEAARALDIAGIDYYVTVILGLGGRAYSRLHIMETARLLNKTRPKNIWCLKLTVFPNTPLAKAVKRGEFQQMTPVEVLDELELLIRSLNVKDCLFEDTTVLDKYTIQGYLPQQKLMMLEAVEHIRAMG